MMLHFDSDKRTSPSSSRAVVSTTGTCIKTSDVVI